MNVYEISINETFFWVASKTAFAAMHSVLEKREAYEDDDQEVNEIKCTKLSEDKWDTILFDDNRDDACEDGKVSLKSIMDAYKGQYQTTIIAGESDE